MAKDTFYFSHDYNARSDDKIRSLIRKHGMAGYGIYWSIIEDLYNNTNVLRIDYDGIAYELRTTFDIVQSIINDFDLFVFDGLYFGSLSVQNRLEQRKNKSEKARDSVLKRWGNKESDTNVLPTQYERNTIKERKGKEIKEKDSKGNKENNDFDIFVKEDFSKCFYEFIDYRKKIKKPIKFVSLNKCYNNLIELSKNDPIIAQKIIDQSIANSWTGLFELKENKEKEKSSVKKEKEFNDFWGDNK